MIHLSTPTIAPQISSGSSLESAPLQGGDIDNLSGDSGNRVQRENDPGFFARLLDGLMGKTGQKSEAAASFQNAALFEEKDTAAQAFPGHLNLPVEPEGLEIFGEPNYSSTDLAIFTQNAEAKIVHPDFSRNDSHQKDFNRKDFNLHAATDLRSALAEGGLALEREVPLQDMAFRETNLKNYVSNNLTGKEDGSLSVSARLPFENSERTGTEFSLEAKVKSGDNAAFKLTEDPRVSQFAGSSDNVQELDRSKRDRFNVEFQDLRTGDTRDAAHAEPLKAYTQPAIAELEIPVDLKLSGIRPEGEVAGKTNGQSSFQTAFENALAREFRGNLSADIIRNATIIAKDGGEGIIRLALRPASLGDVKIHLEMVENKITGLIVVESNEALRAFGKELSVLEKAFRDSGFSEANLEMFLAQDGWNFADGQQQPEEDFSAASPLMAAARYEESERVELFDLLQPVSDGTLTPERTPVNLLV